MKSIRAILIHRDFLENQTQHKPVELLLPADRAEIQDAMERARLLDGQEYCFLKCKDENGCEMDYLPENPSLDELNFLALKLAEMSWYERDSFRGMCSLEKKIPMMRLINMTKNLKEANCFTFENDYEYGLHCIQTDQVYKNLPGEIRELLSPEAVGRVKRLCEGGHYFGYNGKTWYFCNAATDFCTYYSEKDIPPISKEPLGYIFRLKVENEQCEGGGKWLDLPAPHDEIVKFLGNLDLAYDDMCFCRITEHLSTVPQLDIHITPHESLASMITLSEKLSVIQQSGDMPKYKALLESMSCRSIDHAERIADELDRYEFHPELSDANDYGRYVFITVAGIKMLDDSSFRALDFSRYGEEMMAQHQAVQTAYGILCPKDTEILQVSGVRKHTSEATDANTREIFRPSMNQTVRGLMDTAMEKARVMGADAQPEIDELRDMVSELVRFWRLDEHYLDAFDMDVEEALEKAAQEGGMSGCTL